MKTSINKFEEMLLSKKVLSAIKDMGFEEPSPIQKKTIPLALNGKDVIGQAQTGTGKTCAFGIPAIENIDERSRFIEVLVLTPTRELAIQIAEEFNKIGKYKKVKTLPVYGGQMIERQIRSLKNGVNIVVGTPGRLVDHIRRKTIRLDNVKMLILDEADEMLDMGFIEDIEEIMSQVVQGVNRQTLLFSATMPKEIEKLARSYMHNPEVIKITKEELTVPSINQLYFETKDKFEGLCRVLDIEDGGKYIIFCRTKKNVDDLQAALSVRGYSAGSLHGDMSQSQRDRVMRRFREGKLEILIATDVAARGIDIDDITHVINFDIPQDHESYVHRIGRTGRAGRTGIAVTFIEPKEYRQLRLIAKMTKANIIKGELPTPADVIERQRVAIKGKIITNLKFNAFSDYHEIIEDIIKDGYSIEDIAAAALQLSIEGVKEKANTYDKRFENTGGAPGMARLFLNLGRKQKITPKDIVKTFATEVDIEGKLIGAIKIFDKFSFVEVPKDIAEKVVTVMHRNSINGYKVSVEPAKAK